MINIITAIGNSNLNNELKKYEEFNVLTNDILYSDGIIELLEINKEINFLIIGEYIDNKNSIEKIIEEVNNVNNKIKIIAILNKKNKLLEKTLLQKGVVEIFYEEDSVENIINNLKTKNIEYLNKELRAEINNLKKLIEEKNNKTRINNKKLIIGVTGTCGIGKTTYTIQLANSLKKENRILIIDFDLFNSQVGEIFNKKVEYSKINENDINNFIYNIEKNIDVLIGINILNFYKKIDFSKINKKLDDLKKEYDFILVDKNNDLNLEYNKPIFESFDYNFLLSGMSRTDLGKTGKIVNSLTKKYGINPNKIGVIFYKLNIIQIIKLILKRKSYLEKISCKIIGVIKNNFSFRDDFFNKNKIINKKIIKKI